MALAELKELKTQLQELLRIKDKDVPKAAFRSRYEHYEFKVFQPFLDSFMVVFIDVILVYSQDSEDHANHLLLVLGKLQEHQLYAKLANASSGLMKSSSLGMSSLRRVWLQILVKSMQF
ncbi:uncharacterized protein LOC118348010 [Juglans regia]|uniref:Uncharacterized protein LOC118348010 n=1 Tax=Juglans regia TaxID=51240 RepID=A0A6P9EKT8_JUGRE|nr:uncharacterized protein LOC118348010 [Juglans regia]